MKRELFLKLIIIGVVTALVSSLFVFSPGLALIYMVPFWVPGLIFGLGLLVALKCAGIKKTNGAILWLLLSTLGYFLAVLIPLAVYRGDSYRSDTFIGVNAFPVLTGSVVGTIIMLFGFYLFSRINNNKIELKKILFAFIIGVLLVAYAIITLHIIYGENEKVILVKDYITGLPGAGKITNYEVSHLAVTCILLYQIGMIILLGYLMKKETKKELKAIKSFKKVNGK